MNRQQLANIAVFQLGWFACVWGGTRGFEAPALVLVAAIGAWHIARAHRPVDELALLSIATGLGAVFEHLLVAFDLLVYPTPGLAVPYWMIALWMLFATTVNVSLRWLHGRPLVAAALGAAGGPFAYWGGEQIGAFVAVVPVDTFAAIAAGWALLFPILMAAGRQFDGYAPALAPRPETASART